MLAFTKEKWNSYHNTDGYADIFLAVYYTVRDAVDWFVSPTTRWFKKGSNHSFVNQSNAHRRFIWNKATKAKRTVERHHKFTVGGFEITVSVDIDVARTSTTASS